MKKILSILILVGILASMVAIPVGASPDRSKPNSIYFYSLDPNTNLLNYDSQWYGKLNYRLDGEFISGIFTGHGLKSGASWTLVELVDTYHRVVRLGEGLVNSKGVLSIDVSGVLRYSYMTEYNLLVVPSRNLGEGDLSYWQPYKYLFGSELLVW